MKDKDCRKKYRETAPECSGNLNLLTVSKYLLHLRAETLIKLPPEKGSTFHGAFGHALKRISPYYYQRIFEPGNDGAAPKPFVLLPPPDSEEYYPVGHLFTCELTLFGRAAEFFPICYAALEFLGREMGLGRNRGKFTVENAERACPFDRDHAPSHAGSLTCQDIVEACPVPVLDRLTVHLPTRLRLKADGHLLSRAPEFHLFLARLLARINTLSGLYGSGRILEPEQRAELVALARERIRLDADGTDACWSDLPCYSGRQKQWMKFGGLLGSVTWQGTAEDFQPFLPYLAIGEWIHIGGKSSFGLGKYVVGRQGGSIPKLLIVDMRILTGDNNILDDS